MDIGGWLEYARGECGRVGCRLAHRSHLSDWVRLVGGCAMIAGLFAGTGLWLRRISAPDQPSVAAPSGARTVSHYMETMHGSNADHAARVRRTISEREYEATTNTAGLQAPNRAHNIRTFFQPNGIRIADRTAVGSPTLAEVSLGRMGRGNGMEPIGPGTVKNDGSRVEIERPNVTEWYVNSARGLEQGFTLRQRPGGEGALTLELDLEEARASARGNVVVLSAATGRRLQYGHLKVTDQRDQNVAARLAVVDPAVIRLVIDDRNAQYPLTIDPIFEDLGLRLEGDQPNDRFGESVAAGDVNCDGYSDVIVGVPGYDSGQFDGGAAFIFLGSAAGIRTTNPAEIVSDQAFAYLGTSVAAADDVDGNGCGDVIVGAPEYDAGQADEGAAFVFLSGPGITDGSQLTAAARLESNQAESAFGSSVAGAGDVNGDGYADVIVGADEYDSGQFDEGAAFVFLGGPGGVADGNPSTAAAQLESNQDSARLGRSLARAGDVNGDGYADVIVGALGYDSGQLDEGAAFVFLGGPAGVADGSPATAATRLESNQAGSSFGSGVAGAGDVNGDGYADVIVGASYHDAGEADEGAAFVFLGGPSGIADGNPSTAAAQLESNQADSSFGFSVAGAGDVDDDGYADVIVGAIGYDASMTNDGAAFLFLGGPTGIEDGNPATAAAQFSPEEASALGAWSVAGAGDVNGDGYADVIVGAPQGGANVEGVVLVYVGGPVGDPTTATAQLESNQSSAVLGNSVAGAGDVNGDGYTDVIVGAVGYDAGQADEGAAFVFLGGPDGIEDGNPATAATLLESNQGASLFGLSVAGAGDVNGDGYADVIVGAPAYDSGQLDEGAAFVFLGGPAGVADGSPATAAASLESNQASASFGSSVAGAGDVNGDGYGDVIVGAPSYATIAPFNGAAFVFSGGSAGVTDGNPITAATRLESNQADAEFGRQVAGAGDFNGDGYADVIVGAPDYGSDDAGAAFVFLGGPVGVADGNPTAAARQFAPGSGSSFSGAHIGTSVAGAGDIDGDGYADVIFGAPYFNEIPFSEGAALILLGGPAGDDFYILIPGPPTGKFGASVAGAGDVNGDGYADVIIGAPFYTAGEFDEGMASVHLGSSVGIVATAAALLESNQAEAAFGISVAGAGDVNGDGYADVIVGAPSYDAGLGNEGGAFVFMPGHDGTSGRDVVAQQLRGTGSVPVQPWGRSGDPGTFQVRMTAHDPFGGSAVKLQVEACPPGTPFGGPGFPNPACTVHVSSSWTDATAMPGGVVVTDQVSGLASNVLYRWRARVLYAPTSVTNPGIAAPFGPAHGPWRRVQAQGREADLFTGSPDVDSDGDGVTDSIEDAAPNGGDGNGDGIADSQQDTVASLPDAEGISGVTVQESTCAGGIQSVKAVSESAHLLQDPLHEYPFGLVRFIVPCATAQVRVLFHGATHASDYGKFGPTTPGVPTTTAWYMLPQFPFVPGYIEYTTVLIGGETVPAAILHLADGQLGDDTGPDGQIIDAVGLAVDATPPLAGKKILIRDDPDPTKRSIVVQLRDAAIVSGIPGTRGDPTCSAAGGGGATLRVFGTGGSGHETGVINLPCTNWFVIGSPDDEKGYIYKDPERADGPCKKVLLKNGGRVKAVCNAKNPANPINYDLTAAGEGSVGVVLTVGSSSLMYCGEFGGASVETDDAGRFKAGGAAAPLTCPVP